MDQNSSNENDTYSWDMAILAGVIIMLIFLYYYKFLFRDNYEKTIDTSAIYSSELQSM